MLNLLKLFQARTEAEPPPFSLVEHLASRNPAVIRNRAWRINMKRSAIVRKGD